MKERRSTANVRAAAGDIAGRVQRAEWERVSKDMNQSGWSLLPAMLKDEECDAIAGLYVEPEGFRSHIAMARHGFGRGEYKYFSYPLPDIVADLRTALYPKLVPIANLWNERMNTNARFPESHAAFIERCHAAGQTRPTPLLLQYGPEDYNCLHQDLYGAQVFPMQVVFLLSEPEKDFTGGEFILTEQRPRMQSKAEVVPLRRGDAAVFAVHHRPHQGARGYYRVNLRHGVSKLRAGHRHTMGILFHDAA